MEPHLILIYTVTSFTITFLCLPVLIKLLSRKRMFDSPGRHRIHKEYTPTMGGICILIGAIFSQVIGIHFYEWGELKYFYVATAIMFITGLRDDILTLSPGQKLIGQILPITLLVILGNMGLWSFYDVMFPDIVFPVYIAWTISVFTVVILTNAYNLIDGLDGLAGTIGVISLLFFGLWFHLSGNPSLTLIAFSYAGALMAFLYFNWEPSKIFMGDTGALVTGLLLSYFTIQFINANDSLPDADPIKFKASISTAICIMIIPVFDTLRVIILRLRRLQSPFKADKNHLHHQFLELGLSHTKTVFILALIHLFFIAMSLILKNTSDAVILPAVVIVSIAINEILKIAQRKYERNGAKDLVTKD